jgi:hypothetical protein
VIGALVNLIIVLVILVFIAAVTYFVWQWLVKSGSSVKFAALLLPLLCTMGTLVLYFILSPYIQRISTEQFDLAQKLFMLLLGFALGLLLAGATAILYKRVWVKRLNNKAERLNGRAKKLNQMSLPVASSPDSMQAAQDETQDAPERSYIEASKNLHQAEENWLRINTSMDREELLRLAVQYRLRIWKSGIQEKETVLQQLAEIIRNLETVTQAQHSTGVSEEARTTLLGVVQAFNAYVVDILDNKLATRNDLLVKMSAIWWIIYLILVIGIIARAPGGTDAIPGATAFFLTGALVGLFNLLRNDLPKPVFRQSPVERLDQTTSPPAAPQPRSPGQPDQQLDPLDEDFGLLWTNRFLFTPLFSGLAALGGVIIVGSIPDISTILGLKESTSAKELGGLLSFGNVAGFGVAMVFGLVPTLFFSALEKYVRMIERGQTPDVGNEPGRQGAGAPPARPEPQGPAPTANPPPSSQAPPSAGDPP